MDKTCTFKKVDFLRLNNDLPFSEFRLIQSLFTRNGAFGFKINYQSLLLIKKYFQSKSVEDVLPNLFGNVSIIRVKRIDKIRQALSLVVAAVTNQWNSSSTANSEASQSLEALKDPELFIRIYDRLQEIQLEEYAIDIFLSKYFHGRWIEVVYEEYIQDRKASVASILKFLEILPPVDVVLSDRLQVQSTEWSVAVAARFERWLLSEMYLDFYQHKKIII